MLTALFFIGFNFVGWVFALTRGPFWALFVYTNIYFNTPLPHINWWASYLPNLRWSLIAFIVLALSMFIHKDKLSSHKLYSIKWMFLLVILTAAISYSSPFHPKQAHLGTYMLFTFCFTVYSIIKTLAKEIDLRHFMISIISFAGFLSFKAYTEGERVNDRLENIGTVDTFGSNEFGLLLASILPFLLPFLFYGSRTEKLLCYATLPFIINAIILTSSRSALVALVFAFAYIFIFVANMKLKKYMVIAAIITIPAFLFLADEQFITRMETMIAVTDDSSESSLNTVSSGRWAVWQYGAEMAEDAPYGLGPGGFKHIARFYMLPEELSHHPGAAYGVKAAHNSFLLILVEQGYIGFCIFLLLCFHTLLLLNKAISILKKSHKIDSFLGFSLIAISVSFLVILMGGMFNSRVYYEFFWWQTALSVLGYSFVKKQADKEKNEEIV